MSDTLTSFTEGDLVVSLVGDVAGATDIGDNGASPIELEELTTTGTEVGTLVLPESNVMNGDTLEYGVSGEYGSSSEGSLQLAANGQSLVIAGYGVNYQSFNSGGMGVYGTTALAQSYTIQPGGSSYTLVPRVIADISYNTTIDTSTALLGVFNTNNPRSVATIDGSTFYISGQGVKGSTNQGVFTATDGATSATAIYTGTDTRTAEIYNGTLYVSTDSKQGNGSGTANIASYGGLPTGATTPAVLPGLSQSVTLNGSNGNAINASNGTVNLSPENFYFANATTLYVADGGIPKQGGLGDGGLQKWSLVAGTWQLDYTLTAGLNLVPNTTSTTAANQTTGLIGLTGTVSGNTVTLYATNTTTGDLGQTYLFGITDTLSDTTAAQASDETFSTLFTAPAGTNVRGISFAPSLACFAGGTRIATPSGQVPVEQLRAGDLVLTRSGAARPVRWMGFRHVDFATLSNPGDAYPVRVRAGAFGRGRPSRDVFLSPEHAVFARGVLIPVKHLIDDVAVAQAPCRRIVYWHVELDSHDILLAEGMPCESWLDTGNRGMFENATVADLRPNFSRGAAAAWAEAACARLVESGRMIATVRADLAKRARALALARFDIVLPPGPAQITVAVPSGVTTLRLLSAAGRRAGDVRELGAAIWSLRLDGEAIPLDGLAIGRGFYPAETEGGLHRWTNGVGVVEIPPARAPRLLVVGIADAVQAAA